MKTKTAKPVEPALQEPKVKSKGLDKTSPVPVPKVVIKVTRKIAPVVKEKLPELPAEKVAEKTVKKAVVKVVPVKPVQPAAAAPTATVVTKKIIPSTPVTPVAKPVVPPVEPSRKKPQAVTTPAPVVPKSVAKSTGPEMQMTASGVPVRTGRPSSRLAQLTVPSMAQSVASTAAKSSFTQVVTPQPIVPPLASATKRDPKLVNNWKKKPVAELTDEEVIAMSDDDYMNDTQMAFFRLKLVTLKNDILSNAGETTEHLREDTVVVPDPADRATIEEEHALELRTRDRERKLLKKIEQSIDRIDAGDYGYCDETGEPIGVGRLLARPTATLSLEAQQRRELKQKMFGD